jgi:hypothetical protein
MSAVHSTTRPSEGSCAALTGSLLRRCSTEVYALILKHGVRPAARTTAIASRARACHAEVPSVAPSSPLEPHDPDGPSPLNSQRQCCHVSV